MSWRNVAYIFCYFLSTSTCFHNFYNFLHLELEADLLCGQTRVTVRMTCAIVAFLLSILWRRTAKYFV